MSTPNARQPALVFIFITLLLSIMGFGLLIPVLPRLVVEFEGNDFASGSHAYGRLVAIFALMQFIGSPFLGALSDQFGRRRIILIATAGSAIDYVIMANAPSLTWLFVARTISGFTAGVLATGNAYLADITAPEKRAQAFGMIGAAFGLGFVIGPVVGGLLGQYSLRLPFWFAAGCSTANFLWGFFVLPESLKPENRRAFSWKRANPVGALLALRRFPTVLGLTGCYFIWMLSQLLLQSTWALYTDRRYGWGPLGIGFSLMAAGLMMGAVQALLVKRIVPKLGETRAVVLAFCLSMAAQIAYGFASAGWMVFVIMALASIAGIGAPALQAYMTKHVPPNEQGSVQGVFTGLGSLAAIPGPLIATWSFGWAVAPEHTVHLPRALAFLDGVTNWLLQHVVPHHVGIAFFEAAALLFIALLLALRSFAKDRHAAGAPVPAAGA
jgi:DHA1 family tetracycline resistance protein-like MFS transporter